MRSIFYYLVPLFFLCSSKLSGQSGTMTKVLKRIDSLLRVVRTDREDTVKVAHLNKLAMEYHIISRYDTVPAVANSALLLSEKLNYKRGIANAHNLLGNHYSSQGIIAEGMKQHLLSLKLNEELQDKQGIASGYNNIGILYKGMGNYAKALECQQKALAIRLEIGDKAGLAPSYNNIGSIYFSQRDYEGALKNYLASLEIKKEIGDKKGIAASFHNIGSVYLKQGKHGESLENFFASLKLKEEIGDLKGIGATYVNLGSVFGLMKKRQEARKYLLKAIDVCLKIGSYYDLANSYRDLASLDSLDARPREEYEHYKLYIRYRDSTENQVNSKKMVQAQMQYDFDKKTATDSIRNSEERKLEALHHQQEISGQRTYTYGGIAGFVVMIIVAAVSYAAFRNKKKANIEIEKQKALVETKQKEILDSIYYARRIQRSLLTPDQYILKSLKRLKKKN
jgi:tetratricopeptide (TPR) repeat protein